MTAAPDRPRTHRRPPSARSRTGGGAARFGMAVLLTAVAAVATLPDRLFGLDQHSPLLQLVSFRPLLLGFVVVAGVLAAVVAAFRRRVWPVAAGLLAVAVAGTTTVLPRVVADPLPDGGRPLSVLTVNTFEGRADVTALAGLIEAERPDVVALVEAGDRYRSRLAPLVEPLGYRMFTSTGPGRRDVEGVTAMTVEGLGEVEARFGTGRVFPYVELRGGGLGDLRVVAYHSVAPVPGQVPQWRADLALLAQWCAGPGPAVVAGDLNATLDHSALRDGMAGCVDAGEQRGLGLLPTWGPGEWSRTWIGPQIDHVLATEQIAAETFDVLPVEGSDHRAVLARLRIPG